METKKLGSNPTDFIIARKQDQKDRPYEICTHNRQFIRGNQDKNREAFSFFLVRHVDKKANGKKSSFVR